MYIFCLCIICPTLVTKAQSPNFIWSHDDDDDDGGNICLVSGFSSSLPPEEMIVNVVVNSVAYILRFHPDSIRTICCRTKRLACRFTCTMFLPDILTGFFVQALGRPKNVVMDWFHLLFFYIESSSFTPVFPLTLDITWRVRLDNMLNSKQYAKSEKAIISTEVFA